ncbi:MAG TPA: hypothetical protein VFX42_06135 [Gemmatimonadales bacterium]|nr:hypothetical protein [Gemmatimonadales bacterium]
MNTRTMAGMPSVPRTSAGTVHEDAIPALLCLRGPDELVTMSQRFAICPMKP